MKNKLKQLEDRAGGMGGSEIRMIISIGSEPRYLVDGVEVHGKAAKDAQNAMKKACKTGKVEVVAGFDDDEVEDEGRAE